MSNTERQKRADPRPLRRRRASTAPIAGRARQAGVTKAPLVSPEYAAIRAGFRKFQELAKQTNHFEVGGPQGAIAPMFGLASETGSILDAHKRYLRHAHDFQTNCEVLRDELGDLIWYVSAVATAAGIDLGDIAEHNLKRSRDLYPPCKAENVPALFASLPIFDAQYRDTERFPRKLVIEFKEELGSDGKPTARMILRYAKRNAFPNGPIKGKDGKKVGFKLNAVLGNDLTDNSRRSDGYRYHDAIHFGFMAVLGWSPTIRSLLRVKRKSLSETDHNMDGARATFAEEGLAAVLSRLAPRRMGFREERTVDGSVIEIVKAATMDLETAELPTWIWRRAISRGFSAMHALAENKGGFLTADLDARELQYTKVPP